MLIIINGASGAGKTFLLRNLHQLADGRFVPIRKYTTRARRDYEEEPSVDLIFSCSENVIDSCEFHYTHNGEKYGIDYNELNEEILKGHIPVIIIRSFNTIREIKEKFCDVRMFFIIGSRGDELKKLLSEQGRNPQQIDSAIDGANAIMDDLEKNRDVVDEFLFNQYNAEKYLCQFQRIATKEELL
jgi:Guanylate kinase